jgi:dTDP-4-amino-4,6-dideoxygalactose transaminase
MSEKIRKEFLPFSRPTITDREINEVADSLKSGWITTGPKVQKFIEKIKRYTGSKNAVAVNSATAGLHISYMACGIGKGDEVITSPLTFVATANTVIHCGAKPIFADINLKTLNIDVAELESKITTKTKAVVPVHFAGLPCDMDKILSISKKNNLVVIEDAAHAIGAQYKGRKIGTIGDVTVFSFHPNKNITTGEGGMVVFENERFAPALNMLSFHGIDKNAWMRYTKQGNSNADAYMAGFKYNMLDIQAAMGLHQLDRVDEFNAKRENIAKRYKEALGDIEEIAIPELPAYEHKHAWHIFTPLIKIEKLKISRDEFMNRLKELNIGSGYHYKAVHLHPYYQELGFKRGQFPNAEYVSDRICSLPLFPTMSGKDIEDVVSAVKKVISKNLKK